MLDTLRNFAEVGVAVSEYPLPEVWLWRSSLLAYAGAHSIHGVIFGRRLRRGIATEVAGARFLMYGGSAVIVLQYTVGLAGGVNVVRLVYLVALSWHSLVAGISFALLITRGSQGIAS